MSGDKTKEELLEEIKHLKQIIENKNNRIREMEISGELNQILIR